MSKLTGLSMTALFISSTALFPLQSEAATRRRSSPPKSQTAAKVESSSAEKPRKMTIGRLEAHEGAKHFYLKVGCSEEKPELSTTKKPANQDESDGGNPDESSGESSGEYAENSYERNSRLKNCKVSEDFVERITVSPKTRISVTDEKEGGFRIIGLFKKGKYTVKIAKGAQSKTGAVLDDSFDEEVEVPARQPKVRFTSSGRYLPRKNLKSLSVNSVNAKKLKVEVHHIREDNILAWLREFSENSTSGIADKIGSKTIDISAKEDENSVSFIDLSAITGQPQKGVYQIKASVTEKFGSEGILNRIAFWENDENERADARADEVSESVGKGDVRYIMLTDLNLVAKRQNGNDKYLVTVLDAHSGAPLKGASVRAVTKTGKLISECKTSETGCELPATDSTAFALIATHADDLTYLRFSDLRMQIIDEDTNGPEFASKSPYKAALYGDRDIYRPSETVRIVSVVRDQDNSAPPAGMPVTVNVLDSRGRQIKNFTQKLNSAGIFENELLLDPSAATGTYKAELLIAKKQVQTMDFKVEEFAPERIRIVGGYNKESYLSRESPKLKFKAEYLFGGTAAGSPFEAICELEPALFKPPQNSDFHFGIWRPDTDGKQRRVISLGSDKGKLDSEGNGTASCPAPQGNARFAGMSQVVTRTSVMEAGSGRTTQKTFRANVHPDSFYLGLKSSSTKLKDGETAVIKGLFVDHSGNVINSNSEVEIQFLTVKIEYNWLYDNSSERYSLKRRMHLQFESKTKLKANAGRFEFPFVAPSNAPMYLVRVQSGNSRSELEIEGTGSGWSWYDEWDNESGSTSAPARATPLKIKTTADISEGKPAAVKVAFPYKGWALFTVETDKVIRSEWKEIKEAGTAEWNFTVNEFYPNVYVSALLVKDPHQESAKSYIPERAFGVTSVRMSPAKYSAELKMNSPSEVRPLSQLNVTLDLNNGDSESFVTLAAVDEGILQLTGFETPDPLKQLLQQRGLGVETFETIGWNILVPSQDTLSKTGGDTNSGQSNNAPRPVKPVALWSGLLPVDKSGRVTVKLKVPLFRGELRLMAVAVGKNKIATASGKVKVTEPVVIQTTGPRFLTQGDVAQIPVLLTNTTSTDRRVEVSAVARNFDVGNGDSAFSGGSQKPVSIVGPSSVSLNVPKKSSKVASFQIKANVPLGGAKLTITATSGEEKTTDEVEFPLQSPEALSRTRTIVSVKSSSNTLDYPNFESGTERATVLLTGNPWSPVVAELLPELMQYPYGCIEQTTSKLRPLVYLSELVGDLDPKILKSDRIPKFVDAGIQRILSMQTGTGGFAYWPGMNEPNLFGTVFATHVLLDAQKAGYAVPENRLRSALRFISERLTNSFSRTPPQEAFSIQGYGWHIEPYMHYLAARAGMANKARIQLLIDEGSKPSTESSRAFESLYLLKAALHAAGDKKYLSDLKAPLLPSALASNNAGAAATREWERFGFYSDLRALGLILNIHADLFPNDPSVARLADAVVSGFGRSGWQYNTQELGWGLTGLGKIVSASSLSGLAPELFLGTKNKIPKTSVNQNKEWLWRVTNPAGEALRLEFTGKKPPENAFIVVTAQGIPKEKLPANVSQGLNLSREYLDLEGKPVDMSQPVNLGKIVVARLKLQNSSNKDLTNIALTERFPAGFEVENPRIGRSANLSWIDQSRLWKSDYMDVRDNSVSFFGDLNNGQAVEVVVALRATLAGQFTAASSEAQNMYDTGIIARIQGAKTTIRQAGK